MTVLGTHRRPKLLSTSRSNCTDKLSRFEYGPGVYARDSTPSWLCSQMCQSCRLVMSQNSTPSSGLNVESPSVAGWKS